jgi:hypothetical protein
MEIRPTFPGLQLLWLLWYNLLRNLQRSYADVAIAQQVGPKLVRRRSGTRNARLLLCRQAGKLLEPDPHYMILPLP